MVFIAPDLKAAVLELVKEHCQIDEKLQKVFLASSSEHEVRLLEVTRSVDTAPDVIPFTFRPKEGRDFWLSVALITAEEYALLEQGDLDLPDKWGRFSDLEEVPLTDDKAR